MENVLLMHASAFVSGLKVPIAFSYFISFMSGEGLQSLCLTSTFLASVKKRRLCPALNGGAIIFRSASFAHFIVARRNEVDDGARAPLLITAKLSCSHSHLER